MKYDQPFYFDEISKKTEERWKQLELDHELAAPWYQLFKQVQSPRHVISELLQNADDAEATDVFVKVENGVFTFAHNGKDFSSDDFASMCRFGYSNKRLLRTIGFRGIGFKSTFSLGSIVELTTPTISVAFHKKRFTLPVWVGREVANDVLTKIVVKIEDDQRQKELLDNMDEWVTSPFSLLFFNNIRRVQLGDKELNWESLGIGPVPNSEWMKLQDNDARFLVVRSLDEPFPDDSLKEIREERLLDSTDKTSLPPCKVEIVLGAPGNLFVVLPTGVKTNLPFAINAPFVQDPARLKIKDPEISPTNRWLLHRVGVLSAQAMLGWLQDDSMPIAQRARAYDLLPEINKQENSLEDSCSRMVFSSFWTSLDKKPFVLADNGNLEQGKCCTKIPPALWDIWSCDQIISILSSRIHGPKLLSSEISVSNQQKLQNSNAVVATDADDFLKILTEHRPPRPKSWGALLELWKLASNWSSFYWRNQELNINPVRGKDTLYSAKELVRLGEKKLLHSEEDWDFLASHLLVLDANWLRYLTEQRRISTETRNRVLGEKIEAADRLLQRTNLGDPSNVDTIIDQVAIGFFNQGKPKISECIRFTQIAAKFGAKIGDSFRFLTQDGVFRSVSATLIFDDSGKVEDLIPQIERESLLIDSRYFGKFVSCTKDEWLAWIQSGNSRVKTYVPIIKILTPIYGQHYLKKIMDHHQYFGRWEYRYSTNNFRFDDWDFPENYWSHWEIQAKSNPFFWNTLLEILLYQSRSWEYARSATILHIATTGSSKPMTSGAVIPTWVLKLREIACLRDTRGNFRHPGELMRRTPQTEPLLGVEPFVDAHLDFETAKPLLDLLGVRHTPTGPWQILDRIRALAKAAKVPMAELAKWYQRLDALFDNCSTDDQVSIKSIFRDEKLIFSDNETWETSESIFIIANENDAPGAATIHLSANFLSLWRKIGVSERPTLELTINWLQHLPTYKKLAPMDIKRIRLLLGRHPLDVWRACSHWLNLSGEWVSGSSLRYSLSMQSLVKWTNFHDWVKEQTADLQMLNAEMLGEEPFSRWLSLSSQVDKHVADSCRMERKIQAPWLQYLGELLSKIHLDDENKKIRVREQAAILTQIEIHVVKNLTTIPYLNGKPAGLPEQEEMIWLNGILYQPELSRPRQARLIPDIIAGVFDWAEIKTLISYSFERSSQEILDYLRENYIFSDEEAEGNTLPDEIGKRSEDTHLPVISPEIKNNTGDGKYQKTESDEPEIPPPPYRSRQRTKTLIERFAQTRGFEKNGLPHFIHTDGSILIKNTGIFPWAIRTPDGKEFRYFWVKEQNLDSGKPLEMPSEVWHLLNDDPRLHAIILEDGNGIPIEILGTELIDLKETGKLKLFPATYRISIIGAEY